MCIRQVHVATCGGLGLLRRLNLWRAAKSVYGGQDTAGIHRFLVWWPLVLRVYTLMLYLFPLIRGLFALDVGAMLFAYVTIGPALPRSIVRCWLSVLRWYCEGAQANERGNPSILVVRIGEQRPVPQTP